MATLGMPPTLSGCPPLIPPNNIHNATHHYKMAPLKFCWRYLMRTSREDAGHSQRCVAKGYPMSRDEKRRARFKRDTRKGPGAFLPILFSSVAFWMLFSTY